MGMFTLEEISKLEHAIFEDPHNMGLWEEYALYLSSIGDTRGELIFLESGKNTLETKDYYEKFSAEWLGNKLIRRKCPIKLIWKNGFILGAEIVISNIRRDRERVRDYLRILLNSPVSKFFQNLKVNSKSSNLSVDFKELIADNQDVFEKLKKLNVLDIYNQGGWLDLHQILSYLPTLINLEVDSDLFHFVDIRHNCLRTLKIHSEFDFIKWSDVRLPELKTFELFVEHDLSEEVSDLPIISESTTPNLTSLTINYCDQNFQVLIQSLFNSKLCSQIKILDLQKNYFTQELYEVLLMNLSKFKNLEVLKLTTIKNKELERKFKKCLEGKLTFYHSKFY